MTRTDTGLAIMAAAVVVGAAAAPACTVPVYRYALERWPPDPHVITVSADVAEAMAERPWWGHHANQWIARAGSNQSAEVRVGYPQFDIAWYEGDWEPGLFTRLSDSPLRRRIAQELLTGTTVSWILLEGSPPASNAWAFALLEERLDRLRVEIELPDQPDFEDEANGYAGPGGPLSDIPVHVQFALHRLSRTDPGEQFLVRQITHLDPALKSSDEPIAVAVFGRARMIALPMKILTAFAVDDLCRFLTSACSCRVKSLNPGIDMLVAGAWDEAVRAYPEAVPVRLPNGTEFMQGGTGTVVATATEPAAAPPAATVVEETGVPLARVLAYTIPAVLALALVGWLLGRR